MLGDVAVAVHPEDIRFAKFIGKKLWHPFRQELIPVISDPFVDAEFGTGLYFVFCYRSYYFFDCFSTGFLLEEFNGNLFILY